MAKSKIDQINDAFIEVLTKQNAKGYEEYIKSINRELINNIESLDKAKVKQIIKSAEANIDDIALLFMIQNAVLMIISRKIPRKKLDPSLLPIVALIGMYSLKRPKQFVERIVRVTRGKGLNANEQKAFEIIEGFKRDNAKVLKDARRLARNQLNLSQIKSKTSQRMIRDLNKGIAEGKSIDTIKNGLVRKYNKLSNVERALDTELHAQSEYVRMEHSKAVGFKHKQWKTQGDSKVRETCFHKKVANKVVAIDKDFELCGLKASQPGDTRLPPSDRIRCRCYLQFE